MIKVEAILAMKIANIRVNGTYLITTAIPNTYSWLYLVTISETITRKYLVIKEVKRA